ncbi:hypothetical protein WMY93_005133 [Mugilogobius chulae]|uniref:Transmembrane protein 132C n=1 Tax=Mugilogobius chulae TaxID=88201 RepID=A0AAW0PQM8_9GOBI
MRERKDLKMSVERRSFIPQRFVPCVHVPYSRQGRAVDTPSYHIQSEIGVQRVLQVDLKMESFPELPGSRRMAWQVEYPSSRTTTQEVETEIALAQEELAGIVPLAMVSDRCDYVFVNGKEMKGRVRMMVNFTYGYLSAQLELSVWIPRLPLQMEVSDTELSQIKGWRVPITANTQRATRDSEDEEDEDRRGRSCTLQYQHALVRILTHFVADSETRGQSSFLLGSDWQVDITELVWDFLKVENENIVQLIDRRTLVGRGSGMTSIQVLSPLSDSILAEKTVTVADDKVSITELGVQLVTGLSMNLQLSTGSNRAILATATTQEVLTSLKQEALISAWLQFSDGSVAPLELYNSDFFILTATSWTKRWSRVEMTVCEMCQKYKRRSVLAAGNCNIRVQFGHDDRDPRKAFSGPDWHWHALLQQLISDMEDGVLRRATTTRSAIMRRPNGDRLSDDSSQGDFTDFPAQVDLPRGRNMEDDPITARGLTDLEIGMYALLGVFCLAILVFLINCISYTLKYRHKELSIEGQETMNHSHDWVWLGNDAELLESQISLSPQQEEQTSMIDSSSGLEEGAIYLTEVQRRKTSSASRQQGQQRGLSDYQKEESEVYHIHHYPVREYYPAVSTLSSSHSQDIKWVCQDVELEGAKELRNYMERLNDSALMKDVV